MPDKCPQCGAAVGAGVSFCGLCGARQAAAVPEPNRNGMLALVLAVLGFALCGPFTAIPAILLSGAGAGPLNRAAYWLGWSVCVFWAVGLLLFTLGTFGSAHLF